MKVQELFTTQEVAKELSVPDAQIRRLIGSRQAHPLRRIGKSWVFTPEEIERIRNRPKLKGGRGKKRENANA